MNDWFKPGSETAPPPRPKVGILRLVIFAMLALWLFSKFNRPAANVDRPAMPDDRGAQSGPRIPERPPLGDNRLPPRGDWRLDEVDARREKPAGVAQPSTPARSDRGDWSIEEVETTSPPRGAAGDRETRFDPNGTAPDEDKATKTKKGDWSIEEVETDR